ncbi:nucleotide-binding protein [Thiohalophilus thiocyanatoxydans]|uniref:Chromosome partitioning protein n=1 Tax=Thiohalophilus thiocyanatoxydans TaxID=381308 RepID=A0A4R8IFR9_9GAMM|nr:AAA family ATPase [Thiohalophilus thiocyanatoxydans]TDX99375.1 chromosome partitioning protein [Thiohalophilus thiocyanatoxydans]
MQRILVLNSKGGCGKTTVATNLASLYAGYGFTTALMDYDPQGSSMRWHSQRPRDNPVIHGVRAWQRSSGAQTSAWQLRLPPQTERVILDAPAGVSGQQLVNYVQRVDTILVPVLPSPIDIHAATHFIKDLLLIGKVRTAGVRVGVVANRAKKNTLVYQSLERFLKSLRLPLLGTLRDTQHYVHAVERGIGVHELWDRRVEEDRRQWINILEWLEDERVEMTAQQRHAP